ncbi:MAG: hypothetical protein IJE88_05390 [Akkermansia sp.]|nr:hypothetical protein [Akkermansia sp.]
MKKTLITLLALAGVACGDEGTLTKMYSFETLKTTMLGQGNISIDSETYDQAVYLCSAGPYYKYNSSTTTLDIGEILTGVTANTSITFAAWIKPTTDTYQYLISWGEDGKGFKWGINSGNVCLTTKGIKDWHSSDTKITAGAWNLIATTITYDGSNWDIINRCIDIEGNGTTATFSDKAFNDPDGDAVMGLLSASVSSGTENFKGELASMGVFRSEGAGTAVTNAAIFEAMGAAPVLLPEPATATLSLLALAGLAVRRRRK